jgi:uncharacterized protein with beta-barrel porin domain
MTFKVRLLLGAAAPFVFTLPAAAQVTISTATTAPVQTATANNGAASDITISAPSGSVAPTTANTTAVTINSSNDVVNNGAITFNNQNDTVGVRILPGLTGSYGGTGSISLLEDYSRVDSADDTDAEPDGPLAQGSNRFGILLESGGTFTGDIRIDASNNVTTPVGGAITVEGNNSAGVSLQSNLNGSYIQRGVVSVTGTNAIGVDIRGDVSGNIEIGSEAVTTGTAGVPAAAAVPGGVTARGEGAVGVRVLGDVAGEFMIDGAIAATGFAQGGEASNYEDPDTADDNNEGGDEPDPLDPDDLLVGGSAVEIRGDLARGFLVNGPAIGTPDATADVKDVVQNFDENRTRGAITSLGSAPAVTIRSLDGVAGDAIVLGRVRETVLDNLDDDNDDNLSEVIGVFDYDYGFINRGVIESSGINVGFESTGLLIAGSADGAHTTTVEGGIFNGGSITSTAFEANANAVVIGAGAITPQFVNIGAITATANTQTTHDAYGVRIDAGATVDSFTNTGSIVAGVDSFAADAIAFQDLSGTVDTFVNNSRITAFFADDDLTDDVTDGPGNAIAIDLSHNPGNVLITQNDTIDNARIVGDILMGVGSDRFDLLSGQVFGTVDFGAGAGSDTFNVSSGTLNGNATFRGAGANVNFNGGLMAGNLSLGDATGALSFANSSNFLGELTRTGVGAMSLSVDNSILNNLATGTLNLSSMSLTNNARIGIAIDNARIAGNIPNFNITGTADIAANTQFNPLFDQFTNQTFTLRILNAGTINLGGPLSAMIDETGPFLYNAQLVQPNPNAIDLVLEVKDAAELGLNTRQTGAYDAVLSLMEESDTIASALTTPTTEAGFQRGFSDLLPANDASVLRVLATNASAAFGATANRLDMISNKPDAPGGAWLEEFGVYHTADASADSVGLSGGGFGVAGGLDLISTGNALIGAFLSLESVEMEEEDRTSAPLNVSQTAIGAYAGWINGNLAINGAASYGFINFTSDREVQVGSLAERLRGEWKGSSYSASARAAYTVPLGWLDVKPFVGADYTGFQQDGYQETATSLEDLEIIAGDSDASLATASYGIQLVGNLGGDDAYQIRPEMSVGYRSILNWEATPATLAFQGGPTGSIFTLDPGVEPEDAIVAGLGINVDSQFLNVKLGYDTEISDTATTHYGSITLRLAFW